MCARRAAEARALRELWRTRPLQEGTMLRELQRKARRDTETVTEEHLEDAKTLLGLFGAPPPRRGA